MRWHTYKSDMDRARARVERVVSTTTPSPWGPIEYVDEGVGLPVLLSHGIFGGHDNAREMVDNYAGPAFRVIGPSRFGYFGSALPYGATPADQADAYVALLDQLHVDKVVALGFSAGGPSAIQLALRHPDRLLGLLLLSAYLPRPPREIPRLARTAIRRAVGWERGWWLLTVIRPTLLEHIMGVPKGWRGSPDAELASIRGSLFPIEPKRDGAVFDTLVSEPLSDTYPLEEIVVPTLIVHAADDPLAPYDSALRAAPRIHGAELVTVDRGGHLFLGHQHVVRQAVAAFLEHAEVSVKQEVK